MAINTDIMVSVTVDPIAAANFIAILLNFRWLRRAVFMFRQYDLEPMKHKIDKIPAPKD